MDQLNKTVADLQALQVVASEYDGLADKVGKAKAELASVSDQLNSTKKELADASAGLSKAQLDNIHKHDMEINAKQGELKDLQKRVSIEKNKLDELTAKVRHQQATHDSVLLGINALKARLEGR